MRFLIGFGLALAGLAFSNAYVITAGLALAAVIALLERPKKQPQSGAAPAASGERKVRHEVIMAPEPQDSTRLPQEPGFLASIAGGEKPVGEEKGEKHVWGATTAGKLFSMLPTSMSGQLGKKGDKKK